MRTPVLVDAKKIGINALIYVLCGGVLQLSHLSHQHTELTLLHRISGQGELYSYLPLTSANNASLLAVPPKSYTNPDYGISVGRGSFTFPAGQWVTVAQRIKLNDVGKSNGDFSLTFQIVSRDSNHSFTHR